MLSRWKLFALAATEHATLRSTFISDLRASPLALSSASMGWAGFDVRWSNASHNMEMSPLQTSTREGHVSRGIRTQPGSSHLPVFLRKPRAGWLGFEPGCPQLPLRKQNDA